MTRTRDKIPNNTVQCLELQVTFCMYISEFCNTSSKSTLFWSMAMMIGDLSNLLTEFGLAPCSSSFNTHSVWPRSTAQ